MTWLRPGRPAGYAPELLAGAVGGTVITALWFGYHDPRYTMPALVFMVALGAGWIVSVRRPIRIAATVALATPVPSAFRLASRRTGSSPATTRQRTAT